jgi:capsular polysaccharide transport system permease protein
MLEVAKPSLAECFSIQLRVVHALFLRELITRFGRDNLGVLWLAGEPMLFTLGVTTLWSLTGLAHGHTSRIPVVAFAVTGYSSVLMWRNSTSQCTHAIDGNRPLLFHRSVQAIDVCLGRIALEVSGATCSFAFLSTFFTYMGMMPPPDNMALVVGGWLMLAWFGACLALLVGAACAFSDLVHRLWQPVSYLLFPMSGAAFMVDWLPKKLQEAVLYLPMVHGLELLRHGYFGNVVKTHYDMGYMTMFCLVTTLCALYLVRLAGQRIEF